MIAVTGDCSGRPEGAEAEAHRASCTPIDSSGEAQQQGASRQGIPMPCRQQAAPARPAARRDAPPAPLPRIHCNGSLHVKDGRGKTQCAHAAYGWVGMNWAMRLCMVIFSAGGGSAACYQKCAVFFIQRNIMVGVGSVEKGAHHMFRVDGRAADSRQGQSGSGSIKGGPHWLLGAQQARPHCSSLLRPRRLLYARCCCIGNSAHMPSISSSACVLMVTSLLG